MKELTRMIGEGSLNDQGKTILRWNYLSWGLVDENDLNVCRTRKKAFWGERAANAVQEVQVALAVMRTSTGRGWNYMTRDWRARISQDLIDLPAMQETRVRSLGQEDPLEKRMAIHSSILAWRIQWTEGSGQGLSPWGRRVGPNLATNTFILNKTLANQIKQCIRNVSILDLYWRHMLV